ncbi:transmembrane protein 128-like [Apostichopus japonicus]|uniref:transmembrane protein 128-like n=1 Tax=Stichopus japonicus TaxID=307972 RepID=UPI003AB813A1
MSSEADAVRQRGNRPVKPEENEYQLRRRRIAEVFQKAYGPEFEALNKLPPEELERRLEEIRRQEEGGPPGSPYNLHTLFWILATVGLCYFTDFLPTVQQSHDINRAWLYVGFGFIGTNVMIGFYLIVICSWIKKIDDWEQHAPTAVPLATAFFMMGALCMNVALWPVYGILTPAFLFTIFMGFIVSVSMLPSFSLS